MKGLVVDDAAGGRVVCDGLNHFQILGTIEAIEKVGVETGSHKNNPQWLGRGGFINRSWNDGVPGRTEMGERATLHGGFRQNRCIVWIVYRRVLCHDRIGLFLFL